MYPLLGEAAFTFTLKSCWVGFFFFLPDSIGSELFTSVPPTEPTQRESCIVGFSSILKVQT